MMIEKLLSEKRTLNNRIDNIGKAVKYIKKVTDETDLLTKLELESKVLSKKIEGVKNGIIEIQNECEHDMEWVGNGHNKDYYRCLKCQHEDWC